MTYSGNSGLFKKYEELLKPWVVSSVQLEMKIQEFRMDVCNVIGKDVFENLMKVVLKIILKILFFQEDTYHPNATYTFREHRRPWQPRSPPMNHGPAAKGIGMNAAMQRTSTGVSREETQGIPNNRRAGEKLLPRQGRKMWAVMRSPGQSEDKRWEGGKRPVQERADGGRGWAVSAAPASTHCCLLELPELVQWYWLEMPFSKW